MAEYPLSHGQRALWFLNQFDPETLANHVVQALRFRAPIAPQHLQETLEGMTARHAVLRATLTRYL